MNLYLLYLYHDDYTQSFSGCLNTVLEQKVVYRTETEHNAPIHTVCLTLVSLLEVIAISWSLSDSFSLSETHTLF